MGNTRDFVQGMKKSMQLLLIRTFRYFSCKSCNFSSMRGTKKQSKSVKSKRGAECKAMNKIAWDKNDNIRLIHALWGMLAPSQRSLMTVRNVSLI